MSGQKLDISATEAAEITAIAVKGISLGGKGKTHISEALKRQESDGSLSGVDCCQAALTVNGKGSQVPFNPCSLPLPRVRVRVFDGGGVQGAQTQRLNL